MARIGSSDDTRRLNYADCRAIDIASLGAGHVLRGVVPAAGAHPFERAQRRLPPRPLAQAAGGFTAVRLRLVLRRPESPTCTRIAAYCPTAIQDSAALAHPAISG